MSRITHPHLNQLVVLLVVAVLVQHVRQQHAQQIARLLRRVAITTPHTPLHARRDELNDGSDNVDATEEPHVLQQHGGFDLRLSGVTSRTL